MDQPSLYKHLSQITTLWTLVQRAHGGLSGPAREAQQQLLERYGEAVRRYLNALLPNEDAAEEVFQEFACQLVEGDLGGVDPRRGCFRKFVKGVLFHLAAGYYRRQGRQPGPLPPDHPEPAAEEASHRDSEQAFLTSWRDALLSRTWSALAEHERASGRPLYVVLRLRAKQPDWSSAQLAEEMGHQLGRPLTPASLRQTLHRAREKFADLLLDEVVHSLDAPTPELLEEELVDLGLLHYCRTALDRRAGRAGHR